MSKIETRCLASVRANGFRCKGRDAMPRVCAGEWISIHGPWFVNDGRIKNHVFNIQKMH